MPDQKAHHYIDVASHGGARGPMRGHVAAPPGGGYDRFVKAMRIVLPLATGFIALVSIAWPLLQSHEGSFLLDRDKVNLSSERLRMENPRYFGDDNAGRKFEVEAASAIQYAGETEKVSLAAIKARITLSDGTNLHAAAPAGTYYESARKLALEQQVGIRSSNGYDIDATDALLDLASHRVTSAAPVKGVGPLGAFTAGGFDADVDQDTVVFNRGVVMHIVPKSATAQETTP